MECQAYTADFETTVDLNDCRVWAYAICQIGNIENIEYGTSIDSFISRCYDLAPTKMYFHNLGFDGYFIMDYLEKNGWEWVDDRKKVKPKTYTTIISDMNQVYNVTIYFDKERKVIFQDSLKVIPLSVKQMAKAYNLPIQKGELDYEAYRSPDHELTEEEISYIKNDVQIVAKVMENFIEQGLTKMTAGSNALADFKSMFKTEKRFRRVYPKLFDTEDVFIRKAYRGGFTYVNPKFQGKEIGSGIVFDVNSLYPSVMAATDGQILPYDRPVWFSGKYKEDPDYPLWVASVSCSFVLKPNHIPCIQLKGNLKFKPTEYIEDSLGEVGFMVTSVDWELIKQQYLVFNVQWFGGYKFRACDFLIKPYVDKWIKVKNQATIDGNAGLRQIAKLELNSLYGKFATRIEGVSRRPVLEDGVVRYIDLPPDHRNPVYLPVGVFITAYARYKTITAAQSVYDRFVYADTDSLHLIGTDIPPNLDVDDVKLGAWKHESTFTKAKFLRAKCYIEYEEGNDNPTVHVAGMPTACHSQVNMDNFEIGAEYDGKLYTHRVAGGIVLVEGKMQIREHLLGF